jgi:hypothetical protein
MRVEFRYALPAQTAQAGCGEPARTRRDQRKFEPIRR